MKRNLLIFALFLMSFVAGFAYSMPFLDHFTVFSAICIIVLIISLFCKKTNLTANDFLNKNSNKIFGLSASFLMLMITVFEGSKLVTGAFSIIGCISPVLTLIASFSFAKVTVSLARGEVNSQVKTFVSLPIFLIIAELLILFKTNSSNPILLDFVIILLALMALSVALYHFASYFCSETPNKFINSSYILSIFLNLALLFAIICSICFKTNILAFNFDLVRLFVLITASNLFLTQYKIA